MSYSLSKTILAISGSTRQQSTNETILGIAGSLLPPGVRLEIYTGIASLPWFNPDLDQPGATVPEPVRDFRERVASADGVLICTPEYVFSLPGALKNALEWAVSTMVFTGKPAAFIVASASGEKAFESLGLVLSTLISSPVPEECKLLLRGSRALLRDGALTDEAASAGLRRVVAALLAQIRKSVPEENKNNHPEGAA